MRTEQVVWWRKLVWDCGLVGLGVAVAVASAALGVRSDPLTVQDRVRALVESYTIAMPAENFWSEDGTEGCWLLEACDVTDNDCPGGTYGLAQRDLR